MERAADPLESHNWFDYAAFYDTICDRRDFRVFVEVGCWKGHSVRHLARRLQQRGGPVEIFAVDLWDPKYLNENAPEEFAGDDALYQMYSRNLANAGVRDMVKDVRACSWEAAAEFADASVDFVYIDADHAHESVIKDVKAWLPKVRRGGIIAGHDYFGYDSVRKAVDELLGDRVRTSGSVWYLDVDSHVDGQAPDDVPTQRVAWLDDQRRGWFETAHVRQDYIKELQSALEWAESQRVNLLKTAERQQAILHGDPSAQTYGIATDQADASVWRKLADEREQALDAQEKVNRQLEANMLRVVSQVELMHKQLIETNQRLDAINRHYHEALLHHASSARRIAALTDEATQLKQELETARVLPDAMRATMAWRIAERLRRLMPVESRRGQALRKSLRWLRRTFAPRHVA